MLGSTRAAVLAATRSAANTSEISALLGVSPATVSEHCAVLRLAGLITSHRHANSVYHFTTRLGGSLESTASGELRAAA
ncbi:ArsR/SmtB family transcription factor [Streptomyces sp. NPDC059009]|uniref:ArsR/SmtB family transcription factor n=1 Tax=Streptomyces sp. NPDC059009 TaxID=3346694 RepID=UPI003697859F